MLSFAALDQRNAPASLVYSTTITGSYVRPEGSSSITFNTSICIYSSYGRTIRLLVIVLLYMLFSFSCHFVSPIFPVVSAVGAFLVFFVVHCTEIVNFSSFQQPKPLGSPFYSVT